MGPVQVFITDLGKNLKEFCVNLCESWSSLRDIDVEVHLRTHTHTHTHTRTRHTHAHTSSWSKQSIGGVVPLRSAHQRRGDTS